MTTRILALDTSTENCSVALWIDGKITSRSEVAPRDHAKKILPMVDSVLKEAGLTLQDLDALAFGRGPGSFTGVRIGIGIAQGLAFGADLPMIQISSLKAMAQQVYRKFEETQVACAIDARMSEVYWARFERQEDGTWQETDAECVIPPSELNWQASSDDKWQQAGTGWAAYQEELLAVSQQSSPTEVTLPEAIDMVELAVAELQKGNTVSAEESSPVYLRDTVAWKKLPGRE